jgi:hypothetical protein
MQVVLRQETPKSELKSAPEGFEVPWIDQLVPFHFSARVWDDRATSAGSTSGPALAPLAELNNPLVSYG